MKTNNFPAVFYILLVSILCYESYFLERLPESKPEFIWLAGILYFFIPFSSWHPPLFFLITLVLSIFCIFKDSRNLRAFVSFFLILLFSIKFSFKDIGHSRHIWFFASFFLIFFDGQTGLANLRNKLVLRLIQITLLLQYFCSGLWKFMALEKKLSLDYFREVIYEHISFSIIEGSTPIPIVSEILVYQYPSVLALGFFFILIFELFSIVPVLTGKYFCFFGCCAIFFHITTDMIMGIDFVPNIIASLYFLVYGEKMLKFSGKTHDFH